MATQGMNPAYLLDPSLYGDQNALGQQQELAKLLMTEGLTPMGNTQMAGQVALRNSPTQSMAKIAALLSGQNIQQNVNQGNQALMQRQAQTLMPMYFGQQDVPQGQQALGAAVAGQPTQGAPMQPQGAPTAPQGRFAQGGVMTIPGMDPRAAFMSSMQNPDAYSKALIDSNTPNDTSKQALQGGFDPQFANRMAFIKSNTDPTVLKMRQAGLGDTDIYNAIFGEAAKNAEISRRPGEAFSNGMTNEAGMVGKIPEGANTVGRPGPNGQVSLAPMPGNSGVLAQNSASTTAGTNTQTPTTQYDAQGNPVQSTKALDVGRAAYAPGQPIKFQTDATHAAALRASLDKIPDPQERAAAVAAFDKQFANVPGVTPEQKPGTVTGANDAQKQLGERFAALRDTVSTAQTTNSYLDNIKQLSERAATGKFSDRMDFVNALLSQAGSEKATDAKTANDLLNKYSNQIVSRLSTGGLGTDAARTILGSAYPNAKMTKEAISEAVDNIKANNEMQKAKLTLLSPHGNARDVAAYQQKEQAFDQVADPRVFQIAKMTPTQAQTFLAKMSPEQQAELRQRAAALKQMGAFQ